MNNWFDGSVKKQIEAFEKNVDFPIFIVLTEWGQDCSAIKFNKKWPNDFFKFKQIL